MNGGEHQGPAETLPDLSVLRRSWPGHEEPGTTHVVTVGGVRIGSENERTLIAGPCAVESYEQTLAIARAVRDAGGHILRGGAFKPRTNPYSFQGLGEQGLEILAAVREETGLPIVTEVLDPRRVERVAETADMIQIGSRSMHNYPLLMEVGQAGKPVLLKRGFAATLSEWLCAAEYVALGGCRDIVLCERGVRTGALEGQSRAVLDLGIVEPVRRSTPLPIVADPSHAAGRWQPVESLSKAALAAGFHGLLIEVVVSEAMRATLRCDAEQGLPPEVLRRIAVEARNAAPVRAD